MKTTLDEILFEEERRLCHKSFYEFAKRAWSIVDPAPFVDTRMFYVVCEHMQAVKEGEISNLVINIPPRHGKSMIVCVLFHAWVWLINPHHSFIYATSRQNLTLRDARKARRLIQSNWYQKLCGLDGLKLFGDENSMSRYTNDKNGSRQSFSLSSMITGDGAHYRIIDDPTDASVSHNEKMLRDANNWWDESASTRILDPEFSPTILIMQRLNLLDMSGYFVNKLGFDHLCLPFEYEKKHPIKSNTPIDNEWRENEGELLAPEIWSPEAAESFKKGLKSNADGQLQQRPVKREGRVFKDDSFGWYESDDEIRWCSQVVIIADTAQEESDKNDWSVTEAWGKNKNSWFLLDQIRGRWDADELLKKSIWFYDRFDGAMFGTNQIFPVMYIEAKSSGIGLRQQMSNRGKRVRAIKRGRLVLDEKGVPKDISQGNMDDRVANLIHFFGENIKLPRNPTKWTDAKFVTDYLSEFRAYEYGVDSTDDQISVTLDLIAKFIADSASNSLSAFVT